MKRVRVGVVGVGVLGRHHARVYAELPEAELVGVCDSQPERAEAVARDYGCAVFEDASRLFGQVEAVSIAVPTVLHAPLGLEALEAGVHVLVEKPIAADLAQADRLIERAAARDRILQVGHSERFNPVLRAVLPYVRRPRFFEAHRLGVFVPRSLDVDVVLDLMIHDLDLVLWLVGQPIAEIRAVGIPVLTPRVDIANARIEFGDGTVANFTASRVSRERVRKLRFFQASDYISLDFHHRTVEMYSLISEGGQRRIQERRPEVPPVEPLRAELEAFLRAVQGTPCPDCCSGEQGRSALEAGLEIVRAGGRALDR
jgi:predicted dehydrogenase